MSYTSTATVSAVDTPMNTALQAKNMAPLGASVWTGSGKLEDAGITAIAQAASGAMAHGAGLDPTRESVTACIENSFLLAAAHGHDRLALPFIGGGIFFRRIRPVIDKAELAKCIVDACVGHRGSVSAVIVAHDSADVAHFKSAMEGVSDDGISLVSGSIIRFADHRCAAITNAANMEVAFGGGVSGIIGAATGEPRAIDAEAAKAVAAFWEQNDGG